MKKLDIISTNIRVDSLSWLYSLLTMYNIVPKLQNAGHTKLYKKMLRHPNFFNSEPSVLSKNAPANFYVSATFGLSFMIRSVASTCLPTFYKYLISKIRIHNLKSILTEFIKILLTFLVPKSHGKFLISQAGAKIFSFLPHN